MDIPEGNLSMRITEQDHNWCVSFSNGLVQLIQIDFRLGFTLSDDKEVIHLYIGQLCHLINGNEITDLFPEQTSTLGPALVLFNSKVTHIAIRKTGHLSLAFDRGRNLEVDPNDKYEAWELGSTSLGVMMVCKPGGGVSIFKH